MAAPPPRATATWTLALDLRLIATIREHVVRGGDEWRSEEHGDVPWARLFARSRSAWPAHWSKRELAKRWTDTYRRWLPPPTGTIGRAQRVDLVELEALVRQHHSRKRAAEEAEEERTSLRLVRRRPASSDGDNDSGCEKEEPSALLSATEDEYVKRWLLLLADANKQSQQQCRLQVGAHTLDLGWLLSLLADDDEGDVQQQATAAEARFYLALASVVAPQARLSLASGVQVVFSNGSDLIVPAPATNTPSSPAALPPTLSRRQMLLAGLYVAIRGALLSATLRAWPPGLAAFVWWHVLSQPSVSLALPPPPLPLPFTSPVQVVDSLGLCIRQWWVAQSLAVLPLEATMECLADTFAGERQFVLLSLCDGCISSTLCQWRTRSTPLTLIAERERRRFGVVLTLMASSDVDGDESSTVTVVCPSPRSIARFCVDGVPRDIASPQLLCLPHRIEFCVDGLAVTVEVCRSNTVDAHCPPPLQQLASPLPPQREIAATPTTPAQPSRSLNATAVAASALVCLETFCDDDKDGDAEEPATEAPITGGAPTFNSQHPRLSVQSDEKRHRSRVRELLVRIESKLVEKLLRELWSAACAPDSNLGVATVGPSPQKQTLRSGISVLLAMGLDAASRFLDIGSGHGLLPITAALLFGTSCATGVEVERQKLEWSRRALTRLPQREQAVLSFHHVDVCEWPDLREHTHVHAFDYDFPPDVLRHVGWALRRSPCWQVFASCSDQRDWLRLWQSSTSDCDREMEHWWATNVVPFDKVRVSLCGSQARHTLYLFRCSV